MATMYLMNLEDRVDLARNQLDLVILKLRAVKEQSRREEVEQAVSLAASQPGRRPSRRLHAAAVSLSGGEPSRARHTSEPGTAVC